MSLSHFYNLMPYYTHTMENIHPLSALKIYKFPSAIHIEKQRFRSFETKIQLCSSQTQLAIICLYVTIECCSIYINRQFSCECRLNSCSWIDFFSFLNLFSTWSYILSLAVILQRIEHIVHADVEAHSLSQVQSTTLSQQKTEAG